MKTKKDLQAQFDLNRQTVRNTMKCCGLDTSKEAYTDEEVEHFAEARRLIDNEKMTYKQVAERFNVNVEAQEDNSTDTANSNQYSYNSGTITDNPLYAQIEEETFGFLQDMTNIATAKAVNHLPQMLRVALDEAAKRRAASQVLGQARQDFWDTVDISGTPSGGGVGASGGLPGDSDSDSDDGEFHITREE